MNLKWPKTPDNDLAPWYTVAYRLVFFAPIFTLGRVLCTTGVFFYGGRALARNYWETNQ